MKKISLSDSERIDVLSERISILELRIKQLEKYIEILKSPRGEYHRPAFYDLNKARSKK